jgi:hypothetical protein
MTEPNNPLHHITIPMVRAERVSEEIYTCSSPRCDGAYTIDPRGHCPKCVQPNGSGWSCHRWKVRDDLLSDRAAGRPGGSLLDD